MPKIPSQDIQDNALQLVKDEVAGILLSTSKMRDDWLRYYRSTRLFRNENTTTYNKVFLPMAWQVIEKIAPRITAHDPVYELIPVQNEAIPFVEIVGETLNYMFTEKGLRRETRVAEKACLRDGTSFVKLFMDPINRVQEIESTEEMDEETGEVTERTVEEQVEVTNLPLFKTLDIFDVYVDPRYDSLESAPGVTHSRDSVRFAELLADKDLYFNLDLVKQSGVVSAAVSQDTLRDKMEKLNIRGIPSSIYTGQEKVDLNSLNLKERWGRFSPTGEPEDEAEYVITTVNDLIVIRLEKNPYGTKENPAGIRPFEIFLDHENPNELYGTGEVEPTETLQIGLNKSRNQRLDNVDLVMNRMWIYDRNGGINPRNLKSTPGNIIPADDINALQPLATPDVTSSSYQEEDRFIRDFQMATGTIDVTDRGGSSGFTNTATGEKIREREASSRFQLKITNLEDSLARIGRKMLLMLQASQGKSFIIRRKDVNGDWKFTEIGKEILTHAVNGMSVKVKAGSTLSDNYEDRRNDAISLWNMAVAAKNAGVDVNLQKMWEYVLKTAYKKDNIRESQKTGLDEMMGGGALGPANGLNLQSTQINPETLSANGLANAMPLSTK